jgi:hypothetical protein
MLSLVYLAAPSAYGILGMIWAKRGGTIRVTESGASLSRYLGPTPGHFPTLASFYRLSGDFAVHLLVARPWVETLIMHRPASSPWFGADGDLITVRICTPGVRNMKMQQGVGRNDRKRDAA